MNPLLMQAMGIQDPNSATIQNMQSREIKNLEASINKNLAEMSSLASSISSGSKKAKQDMMDVVNDTAKAMSSLKKLTAEAENWMDTTAITSLKGMLNEAQNRFSTYVAYCERENEKAEAEASKAKRDRERRQQENYQEFLKNNSKMIDQLVASLDETSGKATGLVDDMFRASENYAESSNRAQRDRAIILYNKNKEELESLVKAYEESFSSVKDTLMDADKEMREETLNMLKEQLRVSETYYQNEMSQNISMQGRVWASVKTGLGEIKTGFDGFASIFNSLNLHLITRAITQGAESTIDIMSEASRLRGVTYQEMKDARRQLNSSDSYGGNLGAQEVLQIYQMRNLTEGYLSDIASTVAMFEKETQISNESLNGMLLWMQNSGVNKIRTTQVLDTLQGIRDDGADVEAAVSFISEHAALVNGIEEEYAAGFAALDKMGLSNLQQYFNDLIENQGNVLATGNDQLIRMLSAGRVDFGSIQNAYNSGDVSQVAYLLVKAEEEVAKQQAKMGSNQNFYNDIYGMSANDVAMFTGKNAITSEKILQEIMKIESDTSTVASNSDTVGFIDKLEKMGNRISTTFVGEMVTGVEEFTKDHPIFTSLTTETIGKIGGQVAGDMLHVYGPAFARTMGEKVAGLFGGRLASAGSAAVGLGKALIGPVGAGIATATAITAIRDAIKQAEYEDRENMMTMTEVIDALRNEDNSYTEEERIKAYNQAMSMEAPSRSNKEASSVYNTMIEEAKSSDIKDKALAYQYTGDVTGDVTSDAVLKMVAEAAYNESKKGFMEKGKERWSGKYEVLEAYKKAHDMFIEGGGTEEEFNQIFESQGIDTNQIVTGFDSSQMNKLRAILDNKNLSDYTSVQSSNATGLYSVPYNGYIAELHQGERVLTSDEASNYNKDRVDQSLVHSDIQSLMNKLDNREFQKIVKEGFEYIGRKITEANNQSKSVVTQPVRAPKNSLTSMYIANQWG